MRGLWLAALIIFCTYSLHTGISFMIPYTTDIFRVSAATGATLGIIRTHVIQLFGGPLGGLAVDRMQSSTKYLFFAFGVATLLLISFVIIPGSPSYISVIIITMMSIGTIIATMRGVYFVLLTELKIEESSLGFAAGVLSVVGFLPDAFIHAVFGKLLDRYPRGMGYQFIFLTLTGVAIVGVICTVLLYRRISPRITKS